MKLKKVSAAGSKMAVRGGLLVHDKDGVCEVEDKGLCDRLMSQGWKVIKEKKAEVKPEPKPKSEPKSEAKPKPEPKVEVETKVESPKEEPKKKKIIVRRERPSFKRGGE